MNNKNTEISNGVNKKDILIIGVGLILLGLIILAAFLIPPDVPEEVNIITNAEEYKVGDVLKVKIENNLKENICFSSCYPYNIEKKNGEWSSYNYENCLDSNLNGSCVGSRQIKAFELVIPSIDTGFHRLGISACIGCGADEVFKQSQKFYSNDFLIKQPQD